MRTPLLNRLVSTVVIDKKRHYRVNGEIVFRLRDHTIEVHSCELHNNIVNAAIKSPWKDEMPPDEKTSCSGMLHLDHGFRKVNNWTTPEIEWWFTFTPQRHDMKKSQLHAYEKYLQSLAKELASRNLPNVCEVRCQIHISRMDTFKSGE